MVRISRSLLLWLLALAVSFGGFASGAAAHCAGLANDAQKSIAASAASIDPEFTALSMSAMTDVADIVQAAPACDSTASIGSAQSPACDLSGACSAISAVSSEASRVYAYSLRFAPAPLFLLPVVSFLTDAPDRPPRQLA